MSDSRPRPQFGEYATPEQQRAAMGLPPEPVAPPTPVAPAPAEPVTAAAKPRRLDRFLTFGLLAYGLVTVIFSGISYMNIAPTMTEAMRIAGIEGEFTNYAAGRTWGLIATIVLVIGWTLTALLSVRRLRAGKPTWWLPLVGGVVTMIVASVCLMVPLVGDPAFLEYVRQQATP